MGDFMADEIKELTENEKAFLRIMNKNGFVSVYDLRYKYGIKFAKMFDTLTKFEQLGFLVYEEDYLHKGRDRQIKKSYRYGLYDVIKGSRAEKILELL